MRIGDHDLATIGETTLAEKTIAVANIFNHESYNPAGGSENNDITVLELAEEVDINVYTPACLAQTTDTDTFNGKTAQVYGWGTMDLGWVSSSKLLEASVPVVTSTQCATSIGGPIEAGQICAGGEAGKGSCEVLIMTMMMVTMSRDIRETMAAPCPMRAMVSTSSSVMSAMETAVLR